MKQIRLFGGPSDGVIVEIENPTSSVIRVLRGSEIASVISGEIEIKHSGLSRPMAIDEYRLDHKDDVVAHWIRPKPEICGATIVAVDLATDEMASVACELEPGHEGSHQWNGVVKWNFDARLDKSPRDS